MPSKFFVDKIASQFITLKVDEAYTSKMTFKGKLSRVAEAADFGKDKMLLPNKRMFAIDGAKRPDEGVLLLDRDVSGSAMRRMFVCVNARRPQLRSIIGIIGLIKMLGGARPRHFRREASTA